MKRDHIFCQLDIKLTGYGPSNQLQNVILDGDERKYELWETKILDYFQLKWSKEVLVGQEIPGTGENNLAFAELYQYLDNSY